MQNDDQSEDWDAEYLRRLGLITVNFAGLESKVSSFIAQLMIKARGSNDLAEVNFQFHLALTITSEMSFYRLLPMLGSLYKHVERDEPSLAQLDELLTAAAQGANERDTIAHSMWVSSPYEQRLIRMKTTAKRSNKKTKGLIIHSETVSVDDLKSVADVLWSVYVKLNNFMLDRGAPPQP